MKAYKKTTSIVLTAIFLACLPAGCSDHGTAGPPPSSTGRSTNGDTSAYHQNAIVVFNNAGRGVAVWTVNSGTATGLLYAYYDGSSWSAEAEIEPGVTAVSYDMATNGTGFMLAYQSNDNIYARSFDGSSWTGPVAINAVYSTIDCSDPRVASNGVGYAAVWHQTSNTGTEYIFSSFFTSNDWSSPVMLDNGVWYPKLPSITSNGAGYAVAWQAANQTRICAKVYSNGSWSAGSVQLNATGQIQGAFRITSNGAGYAVAWDQYDQTNKVYDIYVNLYNGADWQKDGSGNPAPTPLESGAGHAFDPDIASNGTSYAVVWSQYEGDKFTGDRSIFASIYSNGAWTTPAALETGSGHAFTPRIASNGTGYAVVWSQFDDPSYNLYAVFYGNASWSSPAIIAGDEASQYQLIRNGGGFATIWLQPDSSGNSNITVKPHDGSNWGSGRMLVKNLHRGSSTRPIMATNKNDSTLAVWTQYHNGIPRVYGNINSGSGWGVPFQISEGQMYAFSQDLTTDVTGFMIVFTTNGSDLHARYCGGNGELGADSLIATYAYSPRMASNGAGFALAWKQYNQTTHGYDIHAAVHDGSAWQTDTLLKSGTGNADVPRIASNGSGYAVAWWQGSMIYANIYTTAGGWQAEGTLLNSGTNVYAPDIASNGAGYAVTWRQYKNSLWYDIYAIIFDGNDWQKDDSGNPAPVLLENANGNADDPRIASNGKGYAAVWRQQVGASSVGDLFANVYTSGTGWQAEASLIETESQDADQPTIASDGQGYAVAWLQYRGLDMRTGTSALKYDNASWGAAAALETGTGNVYGSFVSPNGTGYTAIWSQVEETDPLVTNIQARKF
jgi:hypothetical protein